MGGVAAERQCVSEQLVLQIYTIDVRGKILIEPRLLFTRLAATQRRGLRRVSGVAVLSSRAAP